MPKLQVTVENNTVKFFDPFNKHSNCLSISFERTLRIPDDGKVYPLPPSLGKFPVCKVDDYLDRVPESWRQHGGVFLPMYQREAMWIKFDLNNREYPKAIKVAVGKVNAITGETWNPVLQGGIQQDYCVSPQQSWLDGINAGNGMIKQFVAMPLGDGYTVEEQVTGKAEFGGIQLMALDSDPAQRMGRFAARREYAWPVNKAPSQPTYNTQHVYSSPPMQPFAQRKKCKAVSNVCYSGERGSALPTSSFSAFGGSSNSNSRQNQSMQMNDLTSSFSAMELNRSRQMSTPHATELGLSAGGKMKQKIIKDPYSVSFWDPSSAGRVYALAEIF